MEATCTNDLISFFRDRCGFEDQYVEQYAKLFTDQHITGEEMSDLSHALLKEIGIETVGHRIRILKYAKFFYVPITVNIKSPNVFNSPNSSAMDDIQNQVEKMRQVQVKSEIDESIWISDDEEINKDEEVLEISSSDEENEEEILNHDNSKTQNEFEGLVLMNHLISTGSKSKPTQVFNTSIENPKFTANLKQYLKKIFIACQVPPRTHQLIALELIITDLLKKSKYTNNKNNNYLLQHSIGSGKSLIIAALVFLLSTLKLKGKNLFDTILIMNDRKQLDMQLWLTVSRFLNTHGITVDIANYRPTSSLELEYILKDISNQDNKTKKKPSIVFSTLQKFVKISLFQNGSSISKFKSRLAIIVDEAHRSHGKRTTRLIHDILTGDTRQKLNITYFSFTATPTIKALELFGVKKDNNSFIEPFHTYSIADAIRDGHICNPLENYVTVSTQALIKSNTNDNTKHIAKLSHVMSHVTRAASENPVLLKSRAEFIINHYVNEIRKLKTTSNYNPKAMVVANSRICILRYKQIFEELISKLPIHDQFEVVVAFTPFKHKGKYYTEEEMNHSYGIHFLREFQTINSKVQMIIVHSKFLIGFDEPLLHTMYLDRTLSGNSLVQALGRLCRVAPGKKDTCVVDFVNPRKKVAEIFGIYWKKTTMRTFDSFQSDKSTFNRLVEQLKSYEFIRNHLPVDECCKFLEQEKKFDTNVIHRFCKQVQEYKLLCDSLQEESKLIPYKLLDDIVKKLNSTKKNNTIKLFAENCAEKLDIEVKEIKKLKSGCIQPTFSKPLKKKNKNKSTSSIRVGKGTNKLYSEPEIVHLVSEKFKDRQRRLYTDLDDEISNENTNIFISSKPSSGMTQETIEFANGLLRNSHEIDDHETISLQEVVVDKNIQLPIGRNINVNIPPKNNSKFIDISEDDDNNEKQSKNKILNLSKDNKTTILIESDSKNPKNLSQTTSKLILKPRIPTKIVPRIQEISKGFSLLLSDDNNENIEGLELLKKHVALSDNKSELQNLELIPKLLSYIKNKTGMDSRNEGRFITVFEILTLFCDSKNDVDLLMNHSFIPQLNRLMRQCSMELAMTGCTLIQKLFECGTHEHSFATILATCDVIKNIRAQINDPNSSLGAVEHFMNTLDKISKNTDCLIEIEKCGLVDTFFEIVVVESSPTAVLAAKYLKNFADLNPIVRRNANNMQRKSKLEDAVKNSDREKASAIISLLRHFWGPSRSSRPGKRNRDSNDSFAFEPPRKVRAVPPPPQPKTHSITYHRESSRLRPPSH